MVIAAILAGGRGVRLGRDVPKQFVDIGNMPIIIHSIKRFVDNKNVDCCIVAVGEEYVRYTVECISEFISTEKQIFVIAGGENRSLTLKNVLVFLRGKNITDGVILTHDAVRPFVTDRIIDENIYYAEKYGACTTGVNAVDTVYVADDNRFIESVPQRSRVFCAQTPQSFDLKLITDIFTALPNEVLSEFTDASSACLYAGKPVFTVSGEDFNIKITYPDDIKRAEMILSEHFPKEIK